MATIKDIDEMAGVSITTVSRILNNDSSLSTTMETKQKVIDAAKKLNYKKVGRSTIILKILMDLSALESLAKKK